MKRERDRFDELVSEYLDGSLERAGQIELARLVENNPEFLREFLELLRENRILSAELGEPAGERFTRAVVGELNKDKTRFVRAVMLQVRHSLPATGRRPRWSRNLRGCAGEFGSPGMTWAAVAAGALLFLGILIHAAGRGREVSPPDRDPERFSRPVRLPAVEPIGAESAPVPRARNSEASNEPGVPAPPPTAVDPPPTTPPVPASARPPAPSLPPKETPAPAPASPTRAVVAVLRTVRGPVWRVLGAERAPVAVGGPVLEGEGLETSGREGAVELDLPDGTRLRLEGEAALTEIVPAKRVKLLRGRLVAEVSRDAAGRSLVFETPHAEARVLGTTFVLTVEVAATHLEVREGKVRLTRVRDKRSVDVGAGHAAAAGEGHELTSRLFRVDEIVLLPRDGRDGAGEWVLVRDGQASSGGALEAARTAYRIKRLAGGFEYDPLKGHPAVVFAFHAEADKEYFLWVRGRSLAQTERDRQDEVALEPLNAQLGRKSQYLPAGENAFVYKGFSTHPGYGWVGGNAEGAKDDVPVSVRFVRSGLQTLRLYAVETPMRIDAVWLSATQKTRPPADQGPPRIGK